ncbi:uncharacterized protein LOC134290850 [Aedes albopictus]|uniref:Endonuclease n=1 Tax=Aedes albopictus TaxID=7160 RepID=A0ABM1YDB3_AEDAL
MPPKRTPVKNMEGGGSNSAAASNDDAVEEFDALVHMRGSAKAKLTRVKHMMDQIVEEEITLPQVKVHQKKVEAAYKKFSDYHERIMVICPPSKRQDQDCKYVEFETLYDDISLALETWIEMLSQTNRNQQPIVVQPSLPRAIPHFDGKYEQWEKFKVMFRDVVDRSNDPPRIKLYHLEKALIGDAAGIIDAKTIADGNYDHAWEILAERFEDKRRMVDHHISGLLNMRKMSQESHSELRELVDSCVGHVENLKHLGLDFTGVSDTIVTHILSNALDDETKKLWESSVAHGELPEYEDTVKFLKGRISVLERCQKSTSDSKVKQSARGAVKGLVSGKQSSNVKVNVVSSSSCEFCAGDHLAFKCSTFNGLSAEDRLKMVRDKQVCFNCLRRGHRSGECKSSKTCSKCKRKHHTLLHTGGSVQNSSSSNSSVTDQQQVPKQAAQPDNANVPGSSTPNTVASNVVEKPISQVLLLTAMVNVLDKHGKPQSCRALLDSGSQVNFISEAMLEKLQVDREEIDIPITGINSVRSSVRQRARVEVRSKHNGFKMELDCLVSPKVTGNLPTFEIDAATWDIPAGIQLADPTFFRPGQVDLLIGMEWYDDVLKSGRLKLSEDLPTLQDSQFGWLIGGKYASTFCGTIVNSNVATPSSDSLNELMQKFWEVESVSSEKCVMTEAEQCEQHFQSTVRRNEDGRYVVQFPLRESISQLGDSRPMALRRFYALEAKLQKNPDIKKQYDEFMDEYEQLGHCKEVHEAEDPVGLQRWYLPHHAVLKPSNTTTKCRVVFDASAKVGGMALNDVMMVGPTIQPDLLTIILKFRMYRYVLSADIAKMYRQVLKDKCHTPLQRIFYRKKPIEPLRVLELQTVTYGTAAVPFLAIRALYQLAIDEEAEYPLAAELVKKMFYVDNVLFGGNNLVEVRGLQRELISLLQRGGFHLHKWAANDERLLDSIPEEDRDKLVKIEDSSANEVIKTLGLMWDPVGDDFLFRAQSDCNNPAPTKRQVLSVIARLFDPLGLLSPVIVLAKVLMQKLWKNKMDWDDRLDEELLDDWRYFLNALPLAEDFRVPRRVISEEEARIEIHGFADASNTAYGACVYLRSVHSDGTASSSLVTSKSKVCSITPMSIPRKELMAALLLHRLVKKVVDAMELEHVPVTLWSDSQVVIAWLNKPLDCLQVFVRNRVAEITSESEHVWKYVRSADNPADIVSRGMPAKALATSNLWWNGPFFLCSAAYDEVVPAALEDGEIPELKPAVSVNVATVYEELPILTKFESFRKTQRIIAYVLRFIKNCRKIGERSTATTPTISELKEANKQIIQAIQRSELQDEIDRLQAGEPCKRIGNLNPFLDDGLLRVGGRIRHSKLAYEVKHQWIVPDKHPVTRKLIAAVHRENLHAGPSSVITALRERYWILNARSTVRKVTRSCITCFKSSPKLAEQFMGDLPSYRITAAPTFLKVGVDFAGPIFIKQTARKAAPLKGYICVFVCMVSKAMHLEVVENLSTEAFLAALQRFVSRRGVPEEVYSDNGTNFIGARSELRELYELFKSDLTNGKLSQFCQVKEIKWTTIPPNAPHFGGLWEAGVKSVKSVLKKVYQSASLTIMEFATLLCQIEAILNSRPLFAHSSDPNDPTVLTPGHLMINRPLTAIPEPSLEDIPINRLSKWQHIQLLRQHFWQRWSKEYLVELQCRSKWTKKHLNVVPNMIVLLKEDNVPPQQWKMGRIVKTYPGPDDLTRVVDVRVGNSVFKRPIHKLAPLPILEEEPVRSTHQDEDSKEPPVSLFSRVAACSVRNAAN